MNSLIEYQPVPHSTVHVAGTFGLPSDAFAAADAYRKGWPPAGYGTLLTVRRDDATQLWHVEGSRLASCD
jgi:hypothetical protein